jgi:hypothetical protein
MSTELTYEKLEELSKLVVAAILHAEECTQRFGEDSPLAYSARACLRGVAQASAIMMEIPEDEVIDLAIEGINETRAEQVAP